MVPNTGTCPTLFWVPQEGSVPVGPRLLQSLRPVPAHGTRGPAVLPSAPIPAHLMGVPAAADLCPIRRTPPLGGPEATAPPKPLLHLHTTAKARARSRSRGKPSLWARGSPLQAPRVTTAGLPSPCSHHVGAQFTAAAQCARRWVSSCVPWCCISRSNGFRHRAAPHQLATAKHGSYRSTRLWETLLQISALGALGALGFSSFTVPPRLRGQWHHQLLAPGWALGLQLRHGCAELLDLGRGFNQGGGRFGG